MNPAARLHRIYEKLVQRSHEGHMAQVWASVFDIDASRPHYEDDVTACVLALRSEITLTRQRLDALDVPQDLTSPGFVRLHEVAAPAQLGSSWHGLRGNLLAPECRKVFQWADWALRDEAEADMPDEDMQELRAELESLEAALRDADMSSYLRDFIQRQVNTIRAALRLYVVQGARPLQDALRTVVGDCTVERTRVETETASAPKVAQGLLARASSVIKKTAEVCDNLTKIGKFGDNAWALAGKVGPLLENFGKLGS